MIGVGELTMYWSDVPSTGRSWGAPSKMGWKRGPFVRKTVAVCGMELAITASCAWGVPATDASKTEAGVPVGGICLNAGGSASLATKVHGPLSPGARNQRPEINT